MVQYVEKVGNQYFNITEIYGNKGEYYCIKDDDVYIKACTYNHNNAYPIIFSDKSIADAIIEENKENLPDYKTEVYDGFDKYEIAYLLKPIIIRKDNVTNLHEE